MEKSAASRALFHFDLDLLLAPILLRQLDGQEAVLDVGVGLLEIHLLGQDDGARERAPVELLIVEVPLVHLFHAAPRAADGERLLLERNVDILGLHAGHARLDDDGRPLVKDINGQLTLLGGLNLLGCRGGPLLAARGGMDDARFLLGLFRAALDFSSTTGRGAVSCVSSSLTRMLPVRRSKNDFAILMLINYKAPRHQVVKSLLFLREAYHQKTNANS